MLSDLENKKDLEKLLTDSKFVEKLIKLSNEEDIKRELGENLDISDKKEIDILSHEVFQIINNLKKLDEPELLEISGGSHETQGAINEGIEVIKLGVNVGKDLGAGNVPAAFWKLGKDTFWQGARFVGSLFNLKKARAINQATGDLAEESMQQNDELNSEKMQLVNTKHGVALAGLAIVGSAMIYKMFKKNKKPKKV